MNLSETLWKNNYDLALKSLNTNFVQGIKNGNLPESNFKDYIAQDYYFLESFAKAYGLAISKSSNKNHIKVLSQLLIGISEELFLHEKYAKKLEIDLTISTIDFSTKKYTDFLANTSKNKSCIEILSAMIPCMRLYAWLGKSLKNKIKNNPYKDWIITYSDQGFEELAFSLENLIDNWSDSYNFEQLNSLYQKAMELEADFFNSYSNF
tara:strand:+ start:957 stop:1580 length:624 start_codon:yes stop_codon:yes gene_type:complete